MTTSQTCGLKAVTSRHYPNILAATITSRRGDILDNARVVVDPNMIVVDVPTRSIAYQANNSIHGLRYIPVVDHVSRILAHVRPFGMIPGYATDPNLLAQRELRLRLSEKVLGPQFVFMFSIKRP